MKKQKVLIVGGVAGGASAAARLRRLDEHAEIVMFERGEYISFANCGLPYYIGGEITNKAALTLQTPESFNARFNVDVRVWSEVSAIDCEKKSVTVKNTQNGKTYTESYDKLVLSMGAMPIKPPISGIDSPGVFTLRNIPDTYAIKEYMAEHEPKSAVVVGGGYIGVEMAENLHHAGLQVTIVEMQNQLIAPLDYDMSRTVEKYVSAKGVKVVLNNGVKAVSIQSGKLNIALENGDIDTDMVILAIGVKPDTAVAKAAGIELSPRGHIVTNEHMLCAPDVYAVGDAVEVVDYVTRERVAIPLAGPANKQGRIAADNICGINSTYRGTQGSSVIKIFDMCVCTTGINEKTAKLLGLNYDKSFTDSASHATYYPGSTTMSVKTIYQKETGKILGAQIVGFDGVDKRCDVLATAVHFGATAHDLTQLELCYAPPFSSAKDPVNMVGYTIENILSGMVKTFHWHDVKELPRDGSVMLLDTRKPDEYERGHIDGFVNIPLDELRKNLDKLQKNTPIYLTCQVGLRGYIAARILSQNGFDVYNLSGGYKLYSSVVL